MIVVGRHPQCEARLDSLRVSRHHCCMTSDHGEVIVRDLGSTNGIRINGQRVESGRLRPGDELSIAHIRYRLDTGQGHEATLADPGSGSLSLLRERDRDRDLAPVGRELVAVPSGERVASAPAAVSAGRATDNPLAAAVRGLLPSGMADRCRIEVIVKVDDSDAGPAESPAPASE